MMSAFKFVGAYSGILNEVKVREHYDNDKYSAIDAVVQATKTQYDSQFENISAGIYMINEGKKSKKILDKFDGRWKFMRSFLENAIDSQKDNKKEK
jgi:hypothetical protein